MRVVAKLWRLSRAECRTALPAPGLAVEHPLVAEKPTVVFVHGARGAPLHFAALAAALSAGANVAAFTYDDRGRLGPPAEMLRAAVKSVPCPVVVVAHSLGTLLPAYIGATDRHGELSRLGAVYVNPLVGGSRYADADPALAVLGELRGLRWLHGVKHLVQRLMPLVVQDLTPESGFQQTIFGRDSAPPSFAAGTVVVTTDRPGERQEIRPERFVRLFGRTRAEVLHRAGRLLQIAPERASGHQAPLECPELTVPLVRELVARAP